jgi:hypothetical protein
MQRAGIVERVMARAEIAGEPRFMAASRAVLEMSSFSVISPLLLCRTAQPKHSAAVDKPTSGP